MNSCLYKPVLVESYDAARLKHCLQHQNLGSDADVLLQSTDKELLSI